MRILVVEDERKVAGFLKKGLEEENYSVDVACDGIEGQSLAENNEYDLIVLDLMLPGKDGLQVCNELRQKEMKTPILVLTAKDTLRDKIKGLDSGADDYITKPFAFEELLARVRALLRRGKAGAIPILTVGDLEMNPATRRVARSGNNIHLTNKEYALLEYFMRHVGEVLSRTTLAQHVWDLSFDSESNVIDVYINYLRNKVDKDFPAKLIHTVRGVGYVMKPGD